MANLRQILQDRERIGARIVLPAKLGERLGDRPAHQVIEQLQRCNWPIIEGPVERTGATQRIRSVYVRDPDLNLIEISELMPQ